MSDTFIPRPLLLQVWVAAWLAVGLGGAAWSRVWFFYGGALNSAVRRARPVAPR